MDKVPVTGDVKVCAECGGTSAVYKPLSKSIFVSEAEAGYPGRLPDAYAWICTACGHEEREAAVIPEV